MLEIAATIYVIGFVITFCFLYYEENYGEYAGTHRMEFGHDSKFVEVISIIFLSLIWPLLLAIYLVASTWDKD